jgi:hypothetical protein
LAFAALGSAALASPWGEELGASSIDDRRAQRRQLGDIGELGLAMCRQASRLHRATQLRRVQTFPPSPWNGEVRPFLNVAHRNSAPVNLLNCQIMVSRAKSLNFAT